MKVVFNNDNSNCRDTSSVEYIKRHRILCAAMGDEYCTGSLGVYMTFKHIPNIQWTTGVTDDTWSFTFIPLTEKQCELFFAMDPPENVYRMNTGNRSVTFTENHPLLTENDRKGLITNCRNGAKNDATWGGIYTLSFEAQ